MMTLTILGSGTNMHATRAAAGYLVQTDQIFLLDFGPRTLVNLMKTGVDRHRIAHILFSIFMRTIFRISSHFSSMPSSTVHTKEERGRP